MNGYEASQRTQHTREALHGRIKALNERIADLEAENRQLKADVEGAKAIAAMPARKIRAEEREQWLNVISQVLRYTSLERIWGGMEWKYRSVHVKKIHTICEEAIKNLNNPSSEGE